MKVRRITDDLVNAKDELSRGLKAGKLFKQWPKVVDSSKGGYQLKVSAIDTHLLLRVLSCCYLIIK